MHDTIDTRSFRTALGSFCSGITIVAGQAPDGAPLGLACQSFSSLSLDPPLILICLSKGSRTWSRIQSTGHFTVNVLAEDQESVSRAFGSSNGAKFQAVQWQDRDGAIVLGDVLAWIDCEINALHDGGDHHIVVGAVRRLSVERPAHHPLLFFRGNYGLGTTAAYWEWPSGAD